MTTTMHFGPEWMRTKHQAAARPQPPPSPPPVTSHAPPNASTYSALVSPAPPPEPEKRDETHPFKYSKEEMLRIYREGGGKGGLGLEVERWEGVVREVGSDPIGAREMSEGEKKLFAGSLNSDLRRRQSTDYLSPLSSQSAGGDRPRLNHNNSGPASPMRERFGSLMGKRRDNTELPPISMPRRQSLSSNQGPLASSRDAVLPSPRTRTGFGSGFDGVLGGGDSWTARRKAAEALSKSTGASREPASETEVKIKEEEEEPDIATAVVLDDNVGDSTQHTPDQSNATSAVNETSGQQEIQTVHKVLTELSLGNVGQYKSEASSAENTSAALLAPVPNPSNQNHPDLASVEWSYLDPQGNVQGPFTADVMQKWYEGGYFTPDLLMKRTHIDNEWIPVGELARHAGGGKLFLSLPFASAVPPGLSRSAELPLQGFTSPHDPNAYNAPYQPIPTRSLRTSTLDSYLSSTSNPSDSPSSSFGAGQFSNGSPDPAAFGGRVSGHLYNTDHGIGGRVSSFAAPGPSFTANRGVFNEPSLDPSLAVRGGGFGNAVSGRASSVDNYGFNGIYNGNQTPWLSSSIDPTGPGFEGMTAGLTAEPIAVFSSNFDTARSGFNSGPSAYLNQPGGFGNDRGPQDAPFGEGNTGPAQNEFNVMGRPRGDENLTQLSSFGNHTNGPETTAFNGQNQQPYSHSPSLQYAGGSQHPAMSLQTNALPTHSQPTSAPPQSPWAVVEPPPTRRLGPFDAGHPKATNVIKRSVTPSQPSSSWGPPGATSSHPSQTNEPSPWYAASQGGAADDSWREAPGPNSLTFDNVGAHNQQHENPANDAPASAAAPIDLQSPSPTELPSQYVAEHVGSVAPTTVPSPTAPKSKRKTATQQNQTATPAVKAQPVSSTVVKDPSPPPTQSKQAWAMEEEAKKPKSSGAGLGLREIQEAEAKKLEARKAAERERAARAATSATPAGEDTQSFTASWGLPTSRAGVRTDVSPKEGPATNSSSPPAPNAPVWTNTGKPQQTKKTMKEIQEEEERRKKMAIKETAAAVTAARRGYADTTNKSTSSVQTSGSAWTTVGTTGKTSATPMGAVRPMMTPSTSTLSSANSISTVRTNGPTASRPISAPKSAPIPRVDEPPVAPSHDFLKWLSDSLKGLNSSVNFEDITSMLLSFPVDPDPSTMEIISDLIYENSTTLDGRRFASEFVSKRKADAVSKRATAAAGKPASIADVVKSQPKPTQPEWGGFKVVNKKKKGGRS